MSWIRRSHACPPIPKLINPKILKVIKSFSEQEILQLFDKINAVIRGPFVVVHVKETPG
jgi:hypothetical protein